MAQLIIDQSEQTLTDERGFVVFGFKFDGSLKKGADVNSLSGLTEERISSPVAEFNGGWVGRGDGSSSSGSSSSKKQSYG
jgi:hypothetical protein